MHHLFITDLSDFFLFCCYCCIKGTLWHLQKFLQYIIILLYPSSPHSGFFGYSGVRTETQALVLNRQVTLPLEPHPQPCFALVVFQIGSHIFAQGQPQTMILLPKEFHINGMTDVNQHTQLSDWNGISQTFCLNWPQTAILPNFISQVAGITGMSHHVQPLIFKCRHL
jgi:hypothetical protein